MKFKDLYKVVALTYCARVQGWGENDKAAKNLLWWFHNMGHLGKQISNYPNSGNAAICLTNDLYIISGIMNVTSTTTNQDLTSTTTDQDLVTIQTCWFIV